MCFLQNKCTPRGKFRILKRRIGFFPPSLFPEISCFLRNGCTVHFIHYTPILCVGDFYSYLLDIIYSYIQGSQLIELPTVNSGKTEIFPQNLHRKPNFFRKKTEIFPQNSHRKPKYFRKYKKIL